MCNTILLIRRLKYYLVAKYEVFISQNTNYPAVTIVISSQFKYFFANS